MANHLKMAERETIVALHRQGWSKRRIARELGVDRGEVRRLLRLRSRPNSGEAASESSKAPTSAEVLTGSQRSGMPGAARSKCEPFRQLITVEHVGHGNVHTIRLLDQGARREVLMEGTV